MINIRNPERIDEFTKELNRIWKTYFLDWRFGQLMMNFLSWVQYEKKLDLFFPEEEQMLTYLREFCGEEDANGEN